MKQRNGIARQNMLREVFVQLRPWSVYQNELLTHLGIIGPVTLVIRPDQVKTWWCPIGGGSASTPLFRISVCKAGRDVLRLGERKIHLSKLSFAKKTGSFAGETALKKNLAQTGHRIYHAEGADITGQLAPYKAATQHLRRVGSAFHLAGFVVEERQKIEVILQRSATGCKNIVHQMSGMGIMTEVLNHLRTKWIQSLNRGRRIATAK